MGQTWCIPPPGQDLSPGKGTSSGNFYSYLFFCNEIKGKPLIHLLSQPVRVLQAVFRAAVQGACTRHREQGAESR